MSKPRIVILGAGFGGMYVAKKLLPLVKKGAVELTIVNRTNYFLFTPLLHEVATGALGPQSVAEPLREIFAKTGVHIVQGKVDSINAAKRTVSILGESNTTISYDYLLVATGAETNYYGIPGAEEHAYPLKSLADAARIRTRIIDAFERAILTTDKAERMRLLSFVVVGGGATGVETAAELAEFVSGMVKRYFSDTHCSPDDPTRCSPEEPKISLVHTGKELLEMFAPSLRIAAAKRLTKAGVVLHLNSSVTAVSADAITLGNNASFPAGTVIWAAGVKASIPHFEGKAPALSGGRLIVDEFFRVQGDERVFAIGDAAAYVDVHDFLHDSKNTKPVPMLAQAAVAQSKIVAANIRGAILGKPLERFHYHSKGGMVSVGQWFAVGEIMSMNVAGRLTWWIWRTVYLLKFASWKKRVRIAFDWTLELFYPRDITKLT